MSSEFAARRLQIAPRLLELALYLVQSFTGATWPVSVATASATQSTCRGSSTVRHGVRRARLEAVEMTHTFAWEIYQDVERRAFRVVISLDDAAR